MRDENHPGPFGNVLVIGDVNQLMLGQRVGLDPPVKDGNERLDL